MVETLSIRLPQEMAQLVRDEVASGAYTSNSDLVQDALRLWQRRAQRLRALKASLDEAADDPAPISPDDMRAHFEQRLVDLRAKLV